MWLQIIGTAMGTPLAVSFACIFMNYLRNKTLTICKQLPDNFLAQLSDFYPPLNSSEYKPQLKYIYSPDNTITLHPDSLHHFPHLHSPTTPAHLNSFHDHLPALINPLNTYTTPELDDIYIDDLAIISTCLYSPLCYITIMNCLCPSLELTYDFNRDSIVMLDIELIQTAMRKIKTKLFIKPNNLNLFITATSFHADYTPTVIANLKRALLRYSDDDDYSAYKDIYYQGLIDRAYSNEFLMQCNVKMIFVNRIILLTKLIDKFRPNSPPPSTTLAYIVSDTPVLISKKIDPLRFTLPRTKRSIQFKFSKLLQVTKLITDKNPKITTVLGNHVTISYKGTSNLGNILTSTKFKS